MEFETEIIEGKKCPYCGNQTDYIDSIEIYKKRSYGMVYACLPCNAWVGVHHGNTEKSLGRLANAELREAKKKAHYYFDPIWKHLVERGHSKQQARASAYKWLSERLGIPIKFTHIGMFDVELCNKTIDYSKLHYEFLKGKQHGE